MRFAFTEDQLMFRDAVRDVLRKECPPAEVRKVWESEAGRLPAVWSTLAEMGVVGMSASDEVGGMGFDALDLVLPLEESGYVALPDPLLETTALAIPLLEAHGADALKADYLEAALSGEKLLTVGLACDAHVAHADEAALLLLQSGESLHAVPRDRVEVERLRSVDRTRAIYRVRWEPAADTLLVEGDAAREAIDLTFDRAAVGSAAQLLGLSQQMLELAVEYAKVREQFGKPIGAFQAVKHRLANALIKLAFARPAVYRAAYSIARGDAARAVHASMAKFYAAEAHKLVAKQALQVHGAIGYTIECDLHFFMKRGWALSSSWGDAAFHRERVAQAVLGPA